MTDPNDLRWWLVQRYTLGPMWSVHPTSRIGIDRIISGDYMGSAEFEFGAVPESWRAMRAMAASDDLVRRETEWLTHEDSPIHVIASKSLDWDELQQHIFEVAQNTKHLKESAIMNVWMTAEDPTRLWQRKTCAWLLLDPKRPVFWCIDATVCDALWLELNKHIGVRGEDLRMFDNVKFEHAGRTWTGVVKGIYENHAELQMQNDQRQRVPYSQIWSSSK
jgi:hypothetical protein